MIINKNNNLLKNFFKISKCNICITNTSLCSSRKIDACVDTTIPKIFSLGGGFYLIHLLVILIISTTIITHFFIIMIQYIIFKYKIEVANSCI